MLILIRFVNGSNIYFTEFTILFFYKKKALQCIKQRLRAKFKKVNIERKYKLFDKKLQLRVIITFFYKFTIVNTRRLVELQAKRSICSVSQ